MTIQRSTNGFKEFYKEGSAVCAAAVILLLSGMILMGSEAAKPSPALLEAAKWHLIASYERAIIQQTNLQCFTAPVNLATAQKAAGDAATDYNMLLTATIRDAHLPTGTVLQVTPDFQDVTVTVPPPAAPEAKK